MNLTARDKLLMLFIPSVLVVAGYSWFFFWGKQSECTRIEKTLDEARNKEPMTRAQVLEARRHLAGLGQENAKLDKETQEARQKWLIAAGKCADPELRNERIEKLTSLLTRHQLRLVEDGEAAVTKEKEGKMPVALEPLAKQMAKLADRPQPQLRRVCLQGRYADVLEALEELGQGEVLAIPVGISMKETKEGADKREWSLLVWI